MGVLKAGERQTEVVEPAVQQLAGDGDAEIGDLGEVDNPMRPGGCSWRKITSRSGPFTARHA